MIFIKALIWKRWKELKNSRKLLGLILLPLVCFILFYFLKIPKEKMFFYFSTVVTYLSMFIHWNPEDLIYSGYLLATPFTPKKSWVCNAVIITVSSYIYSYIVLILFSLIFGINLNMDMIAFGLINIFLAFSLVLSNTLYFVDYSIVKQCLQMPFGLFSFAIVACVFFFPNVLGANKKTLLICVLISIVITGICLLINRKNNSEILFINTKKLLDNVGNVIDE